MAQVHITYYKTMAVDGNAATMQVPMEPALSAEIITVSTAGSQSAQFPADARFVGLTADNDVAIWFGEDPQPADAKTILFAGTYRFFGVRANGLKMVAKSLA